MAKYYGPIGFAETVETTPGVWKEQITERNYYSEVVQNNRRLESSGGVNDNINISNRISITADPYAKQNFHSIRYAEFMGTKWKVTEASVSYPKITLTLGGVYNGTTT